MGQVNFELINKGEMTLNQDGYCLPPNKSVFVDAETAAQLVKEFSRPELSIHVVYGKTTETVDTARADFAKVLKEVDAVVIDAEVESDDEDDEEENGLIEKLQPLGKTRGRKKGGKNKTKDKK